MSSLTVLPRAGYKKLPWKNGLGSTLEIAIHPARASAANGKFDFRLSHATVDQPAEFSSFPDHDRILIVKDGAGLRLIVAAGEARGYPRELAAHVPLAFSGTLALRSELLSGPVTDLNVFVRESSMAARVEVQAVSEKFTWAPKGQWSYAFVLAGEVTVAGPGTPEMPIGALRDGDTVAIEGPGSAIFSASSGTAKLALIEIEGKNG